MAFIQFKPNNPTNNSSITIGQANIIKVQGHSSKHNQTTNTQHAQPIIQTIMRSMHQVIWEDYVW